MMGDLIRHPHSPHLSFMPETPWEFAIDVGGTFTDCLAYAPDGRVLRHKLLSSGVTKGTLGLGSTSQIIVDPLRQHDPADFWNGYEFALLDDQGQVAASSNVESFEASSGTLQLREELAAIAKPGSSYELRCQLEAPVIGIRYLLGLPLATAVPPVRLRLGTTRGTNALLTRTGARTALVTTQGFADLLEIGDQARPRLFDLTVCKTPPLMTTSIEIPERIAADGEVLQSLDVTVTTQKIQALYDSGIDSLAICLLHADLYPAHEQQVAAIARKLGFAEISCSHEIAPLVKIVPRAETTVVDAYLNPVLRDYLAKLQASLPGSQLKLMTSAGGLVPPSAFHGHESVLSGPAGGVVGYAQAARRAGFDRAIGFDMGGTSTDVSRFDGAYEFDFESRKAGVRLVAPTLAIETVAAGGGSICHFDGTKLTVGPDSAGADPGPACYGRGGPLTVTDLNFYLGRIAVERFPFLLQRPPVEQQLTKLAAEVDVALGEKLTNTQLAEGLLKIANANMARAVRSISVAKGADPVDYVLVAFGGAAAQHACGVARELEIRKVLNHPDAGILSAYGIGQADAVRHAVTGMSQSLDAAPAVQLEPIFAQLEAEPRQEILDEGFLPAQISVQRSLDLRYFGTDASLSIDYTPNKNLGDAFQSLHRQQFGYAHEGNAIEIAAARVQVIGAARRTATESKACLAVAFQASRRTTTWFENQASETALLDRDELSPGARINGPAIIADQHSTIVVEPGWQAEMLSAGELLLTDAGTARQVTSSVPEAVMLEVFNNLFAGIAEQMGHILRRTASSVNVKERLDYSCAVFTSRGELIANAPHVPVHLGAMGLSVRSVLEENPNLQPGDVYVTNDPYRGGSHLPDITVITPVHDSSGQLLFFTACRAHHAEIGGVRPGSMPPSSTSLAEEGVLITNFALVKSGQSREAELRTLLTTAPYPSRRVDENLADVRAQVAANRQGATALLELVERYGWTDVEFQLDAIQAAAEQKVRQALAALNLERGEFVDYLELADGQSVPIQVTIDFQSDPDSPAAVIDFEGTAPVVRGNLNANRAIVTAAVLYVLRLLVDEDIPLNEGALRAVEIRLPECLLNPPLSEDPSSAPAVAAGNVETSQRVVDVLLGALGVAAASQGTMNNLLFGNAEFGYYETIAGGSGATAQGPGADTVQIHMTNTRATDPEVLERRLTVRLHQFAIRRGSGGAGHHRGGDGVVRELEFLAPLDLSLITQRRGPHPPYGLAGGAPGAAGRNTLMRSGGKKEALGGICELTVDPGERLVIETPGGGGWGKADRNVS